MKEELILDKQTQQLTGKLPVMESFYTIQGEGYHTGTPAYFVRLGGCDVGCVWCDVKESWDESKHPSKTVEQIVADIELSEADKVVVTGGEPLMYDLTDLTAEIHAMGRSCHIETSGVYPSTGSWDWICFSPKKFKACDPVFYEVADELKVVIYHKSDFQWAQDHAQKMNHGAHLYLQPEWSRTDEMLPLIIDYVKEHPEWRISLQTHKYMQIP